MESLELIKELSNLHGTSGFEDEVIEFISKKVKGKAERDSINNLFIGLNKIAAKPVVALDCHSDEVGFMVEGINPNGTLSVLPLGGWHNAVIPAHAVKIKNAKGEYVDGVVASKPPHFMSAEERNRLPKLEEMSIDLGTSSWKETQEIFNIEVGNPITPDVTFKYDEKLGVMRGKALDNRLGCAAVVEVINEMGSKNLNVTPVGVIASQEEVGLRGAQVAANRLKPDFAIIFEGSPADDTFKSEFSSKSAIGKGIQFRVVDGGMISNHRVLSYAKKIAEENGIPYQVIARSGGSTNGARYHMANEGIPTLVIGIPTRYIHTHYGYASLKDYKDAVKFGKLILEKLTKKDIENF